MKKKLLITLMFTLPFTGACARQDDGNNNNQTEVATVDMGMQNETPAVAEDTSSTETTSQVTTPVASQAVDSVEDQIAAFVAAKDSWFIASDYDTYCYSVTDFNQDGQLELVVSSCQGSGLYSYNQFYTVDRDNGFTQLQYKSLVEGDSEPDILCDELVCYHDANTGIYYYIVEDILRCGANEVYLFDYAMSVDSNNYVETDLIKTSSQLYYDNPDGDFAYFGKDGNEITEDEFNNIENILFADCDKKTCSVSWIIAPSEDEDFTQLLTESWNGFN